MLTARFCFRENANPVILFQKRSVLIFFSDKTFFSTTTMTWKPLLFFPCLFLDTHFFSDKTFFDDNDGLASSSPFFLGSTWTQYFFSDKTFFRRQRWFGLLFSFFLASTWTQYFFLRKKPFLTTTMVWPPLLFFPRLYMDTVFFLR